MKNNSTTFNNCAGRKEQNDKCVYYREIVGNQSTTTGVSIPVTCTRSSRGKTEPRMNFCKACLRGDAMNYRDIEAVISNVAHKLFQSLNRVGLPTSTYRGDYRTCRRTGMLVFALLLSLCVAKDVDLSLTLPASKGFRVLGAAISDFSGSSVSAAGDVNGDGIGDFIVGATWADPPTTGTNGGISYVIFGRNIPGGAATFGDIQLTTGATALSPTVGFRILCAANDDRVGTSVSAAGDVNGDGIDDLIVGAPLANPPGGGDAGISYVIFGRNIPKGAAFFGDIRLTTGATAMATDVGFRILGGAPNDQNGWSVCTAGDVNGDGIGDVIVGAPYADAPSGADAGIAYVIFGRNTTVQGSALFDDIQLTYGATALLSNVGFRILGASSSDQNGYFVSAAGDVNGDGISDVLTGAPYGDPLTGANAGITYVIFGRNIPGGAAAFGDIQLTTGGSALSSNVGFRMLGATGGDLSGWCGGAAGDLNGDGIGDVIIGAIYADPSSGADAGISYVIFGRNINAGASAFGDIQLTTGGTALSPSVGFRILGAAADDQSGRSVSAAGDVNGDGVGDVIVGAPFADPPIGSNAGICYVVFGRNVAGGAPMFGDVQLAANPTMSSAVGFRILGAAAGDENGRSVSAVGDINGDGISDVIVGAPQADPPSKSSAGISFIIFGAYSEPTSQPSNQPSRQPTSQPTRQPSRQPTRQPSQQPSARPSRQPSMQPSRQPSAQPSGQPISLPSAQPTIQPSNQPSNQPSRQPSGQPTFQPSTQPSGQPSAQPSGQPISKPSGQPTTQPSNKPSMHPSRQPSGQPPGRPSTWPSGQPSAQPSRQPLSQPTSAPSGQPSTQPSAQPSGQPSGQPSRQPSRQPTTQPTASPSKRPSNQPSGQPSELPSSQPVSCPSTQPSKQPSFQPSTWPTNLPTSQPTEQPSTLPSNQPACSPSAQPSGAPSQQPTTQPTCSPSWPPSARPSQEPSKQPSRQPSSHPTKQPSLTPSSQLSVDPSAQPSSQPSGKPSSKPLSIPSAQPSAEPSSTPTGQPTLLPTKLVFTGEWVRVLDWQSVVTLVAGVGDVVVDSIFILCLPALLSVCNVPFVVRIVT